MILTHPGLTKLTFMDYLLTMLRILLRRKLGYNKNASSQKQNILPSPNDPRSAQGHWAGCTSTPKKVNVDTNTLKHMYILGSSPRKRARKIARQRGLAHALSLLSPSIAPPLHNSSRAGVDNSRPRRPPLRPLRHRREGTRITRRVWIHAHFYVLCCGGPWQVSGCYSRWKHASNFSWVEVDFPQRSPRGT